MLRSAEKLFLDCMKNPEVVIEAEEIITEVLLELHRRPLRDRRPRGRAATRSFASGSIMSKDLWMKMEGPFTKRLADRVHEHGRAVRRPQLRQQRLLRRADRDDEARRPSASPTCRTTARRRRS